MGNLLKFRDSGHCANGENGRIPFGQDYKLQRVMKIGMRKNKSFRYSIFDIGYCTVLLFVLACLIADPASAGPYLDSAHGNATYGVNRSSIDSTYTAFATGNCAHCHEMHASIGGAEPSPVTGPEPHTLFAPTFNAVRTQNPYLYTDDFCFYCHSSNSGQKVKNQDYSATFGGAANGTGPQTILDAFNQASYHNLYDIMTFLNKDTTYGPWFATIGNPCSACHNSHLAKRNWDSSQTGFPLLSTISMPGVTDSLWGETQLMSSYFSYEAPFAILNTNREPAGVGDQNGANTPDYNSFCTSCHNPDKTIWSTTLNRDLKKVNFGDTGLGQEKHGALARDGSGFFRAPYAAAAALKSNFILSCLDCHEPHGSQNIMLLRRRINGEDLEGTVTSTDDMSYVCKRCHTDDLAAGGGTGQANRWQYIHHSAPGAPYAQATTCTDCHSTADGSTPVACGNCHGHGMDDSWAGADKTGLVTF